VGCGEREDGAPGTLPIQRGGGIGDAYYESSFFLQLVTTEKNTLFSPEKNVHAEYAKKEDLFY